MQAVRLVTERKWSIRKVARHIGYSHCTVRLWLQKTRVWKIWHKVHKRRLEMSILY